MSVNVQRVVCGLIQENAYIVSAEGRDDCVVVDPGDEYPKLKAALAGLRVGAVLLTHGHFDHLMAAGEMAAEYGAPVYVAQADLPLLNDPSLNGYRNLMGVSRRDWPEVEAQPYGEALSACALTFQVLPTPGHTRGSVCLYLEDAGLLFSGDTLFRAGYGRLDLFGGSVRDMGASLRHLFALPADVRVYPGHGEATTIGEEGVRYHL